MNQIQVVHLINDISPASIPLELAQNINREMFKVTVISYFDSEKSIEEREMYKKHINLIGLGAKHRLDLNGIFGLYNILKRKSPDILHVHHNWSGSIGRVISKLLGSSLVVNTEHTDHKKTRSAGIFFNSLTIGLSDLVVCNSNHTCNSFFKWEGWLIAPHKKQVIYNGIDINKIDQAVGTNSEVTKRFNIRSSDYLIGNIGMLKRAKDQKTLIKALKRVLNVIEDAKLVIVGDGELRSELTKLAKKLGIRDRVIFTGLLERNEVYQLLYAFDLFVMISLWEGFCNAVVEAMAAELPVIVTNVEPLPEVVGRAGKYVPPKDPHKLAKAIIEMYEHPEEAIKLAANGRKRAVEKFSLEKSVANYERLYLDLIKRRKRSKKISDEQ